MPLYKEIFGKYKGQPLPPKVGLEREMADLGVAEKQKDRARQAFQRSAEQAGFFKAGKGKLVLPASSGITPKGDEDNGKGGSSGGGGGGGGGGDDGTLKLHPLIRGLVQTLREPGTEWSEEDQKEWLEAAQANFKLIYKRPKRAISASEPQPPFERSPGDAQG